MIKTCLLSFALLLCAAPVALAAGPQDSEHDAGYTWAQDKGITNPADCGGASPSFIEGCQAAALEQFDPNAIAPAAGGDNPADPNLSTDTFIDDPFYKDPFEPEALPVPGSNPFGQ